MNAEFCFFLVVLVKCHGLSRLYINPEPEIPVLEGHSAMVACHVTLNQSWISLNIYVHKLEKLVIGFIFYQEGCVNYGTHKNPRFEFTCNMTEQTFKLDILNITASDHHTKVGCELKVSRDGDKEEKSSLLSVIVPTKKVTISHRMRLEIKEGDIENISCSADLSRPPSKIKWYLVSDDRNVKQLNVSSNSERKVLDSSSLYNVTSVLSYQAHAEDNGYQIYCEADIGYQIYYEADIGIANQTLKSRFLTLDVHYGPKNSTRFSLYGSPMTILEGESIGNIGCFSDCNPVCEVYWTKGNQQIGNNSDLSIEDAIPSMAGVYVCHAQNRYGERRKELQIIVSHIKLSITPINQICENGESMQITCNVRVVSSDFVLEKWTHTVEEQSIRSINGRTNVSSNVLYIPFCGYQDSGIYTCRVKSSEMNEEKMESSEVIVHAKPVMSDFVTTTFNQQRNMNTIRIKFYAVPKPFSVEWLKDGRTLTLSEKYQQKVIASNMSLTFYGAKVVVSGYEANLDIDRFEEKDYGTYVLRVENEKGVATQSVVIKNNDIPLYILLPAIVGVILFVLVAVCVICIVRHKKANVQGVAEITINRQTSQRRSSYDAHGSFDVPVQNVYDVVNNKENNKNNSNTDLKQESLRMSTRSRTQSTDSKSNSSGYIEAIA